MPLRAYAREWPFPAGRVIGYTDYGKGRPVYEGEMLTPKMRVLLLDLRVVRVAERVWVGKPRVHLRHVLPLRILFEAAVRLGQRLGVEY